ncbi:STM3941 family protein [Carboxylicivirga sp. RSCT41]|uniref:STM3941 family protein n=1 Tax=Carboxylicivirga agarovorans TaxID=3417570 RepID=UPI003D32B2AD
MRAKQSEIPVSKKKLALLIFAAIAFVIFGIWKIMDPPTLANPFLGNLAPVFMIIQACKTIFILSILVIMGKLFAKKVELAPDQQQTIIPTSKRASILGVSGFGIFSLFSLEYILTATSHKLAIFGIPLSIIFYICGITLIIISGPFFIVFLRKLFNSKPGLIINGEGIIDNTGFSEFGLVKWSDIAEIKIATNSFTKTIILIVKNPDTYIERLSNPFLKALVRFNNRRYGYLISIGEHALNCHTEDLLGALNAAMKDNKS